MGLLGSARILPPKKHTKVVSAQKPPRGPSYVPKTNGFWNLKPPRTIQLNTIFTTICNSILQKKKSFALVPSPEPSRNPWLSGGARPVGRYYRWIRPSDI